MFRQVEVGFFSPLKDHFDPDFLSLLQEFFRFIDLNFDVVLTHSRSQPDSLDHSCFLLFFLLPIFLFYFVFELTEIGDSRHGRFGFGVDLDQIQALLSGYFRGLAGFDIAEKFSVFIDQADLRGNDLIVETIILQISYLVCYVVEVGRIELPSRKYR